MEITLKGGRKLNGETLSAKGDVGNPPPRQEEVEKALDLMAPVLRLLLCFTQP